MKRSEINHILGDAIDFLNARQFLLPPFAYWTPEEWKTRGEECKEIPAGQLGWDITDFGAGDFEKMGLFLFTIRNGDVHQPDGKSYAEKILIVQPGQVTPAHYHASKMEDIINRGGGNLVLRLWNSTEERELAETEVSVMCDGVERRGPAGETITLLPGESVTLPPYLYHAFWGEGETVLVGEVSRVNDDATDNFFYDPVGRFPEIEEDEAPRHLLTLDYPAYYAFAEANAGGGY